MKKILINLLKKIGLYRPVLLIYLEAKSFFYDLRNQTDFLSAKDNLKKLEISMKEKNGDLFMVPFEFKGYGNFEKISPSQTIEEVRELYQKVKLLSPKNVVEIGTDKGGTLYLWAKASADNANVISIDLQTQIFGRKNYKKYRRDFYELFNKTDNQTITCLASNSQLTDTLEKVKKLLNYEKIDFLFIDGDHSYEGVKRDYELYSPLVRDEGLIVFHDIKTVRENIGVPRFWKEIKEDYTKENITEITYSDFGPIGAGIGVLKHKSN